MATNIQQRIALLTSSQEFSGSITKIQAIGAADGPLTASLAQTCSLNRLEAGDHTTGVTSVISSAGATITVEPGTVIDGPIARIKGHGAGEWLV